MNIRFPNRLGRQVRRREFGENQANNETNPSSNAQLVSRRSTKNFSVLHGKVTGSGGEGLFQDVDPPGPSAFDIVFWKQAANRGPARAKPHERRAEELRPGGTVRLLERDWESGRDGPRESRATM